MRNPKQHIGEEELTGGLVVFYFIIDVWPSFCKEIIPQLELIWKMFCSPQLNSLQTENTTLRWQTPSGQQHLQGPFGRHPPRGGRAMSMYETGSSPRQYPHRGETTRQEDGVVLQPFPTNVSTKALSSQDKNNDAWLWGWCWFFIHSFSHSFIASQ